ncbi:DUF3626 domain-containing protein [Streptomyces sp. NPDC051940]|uniref:DUF3626 domain-containing protein n=1 Tax=Streptomyces sp. NPDC051940 TaxID=3155675 RepID=UPI003449BE97
MTSHDPPLTAAQRAALDHVRASAPALGGAARLGAVPSGAAVHAAVRERARVTLNFHPDRLLADGSRIAERLAADGRYRGQFETGVSNGSRTAHPGGDRDRWEESLFGGAYHGRGVAPGDRPKYGALNVLHHPDGAAPRFGSCHVRLRAEVAARCTFCVGDSHAGPVDVGTYDAFEAVLAGVLEEASETGLLLGVPTADPAAGLGAAAPVPGAPNGAVLDHYVEAQVHGPVDLARDAEALVLDPSFAGTAVGDVLTEAAARFGVGLEWHTGFVLHSSAVPAGFRGPAIPPLADRVARRYTADGMLTAEVVGRAAASLAVEPGAWAEFGTYDEVLQYVKQLWHVLVEFGEPYATGLRARNTSSRPGRSGASRTS